jgi:glyoxylase-like metal-dependent hydrolase (beta-lactamase superfamily II)
MIQLNRRTVLGGAAAASAATALPPFAALKAQAQAQGFHRYKVGSIDITVVTDGSNTFKFPDTFVTNKTRDEVNKAWVEMAQQADQMVVPYSPIVVKNGARTIVIDTGRGAAGQFQANLKAAGIDAGQVDTVIISHFHGDHINGLVDKEGKPAFAKAEVLVPAAEFKYWMDDGEMSKQTTDRMKGAFGNARKVMDGIGRKVTQYEAGKEVAPGITSVATHGHTPGHMSFIIASGNGKVFVQSDVTNNPLFARNPGFHIMFDQDAQMAEATRRKVYDMLVADKVPLQGFHYPFPALARIEKTSTGYREIPITSI